ncbi:MAG TPA: TIGR03435 family protein [Bryobacteraceae bacterium]|nr:TIGR03435 family protein [Bryobacteraceae bacterium]
MSRIFFLLTIAAAGLAQTAPATFDVTSIRTAAVVIRDPHAFPVHFSPTSVTMRSVTLKGAIAWSWSVLDNEVQGPGWLDSDYYDVIAKTSTPHTEDELRRMFQAVLAERFGVRVHRDRKVTQAYVLTVDKAGLKMTETAAEGESTVEPQPQRMAVAMRRTSMSEIATLLSRILQAPVVDATNLKGRYDADFDMTKYAQDLRPAEGAPIDIAGVMTTALREEIGLRIELKKTPVDIVSVDHAEKMPEAN